MEISSLTTSDWTRIFAATVALITFIWSVASYLAARKRELKWKRAEFLFEQAKYLDTDKEINYAVAILDGTYDTLSEYRMGFDKLLNLLDRLAWASLKDHVISEEELSNFGWYYSAVIKQSRVVKYCENNGYDDVIKIAQEL
jgi:hypothetical protein